MKAAGSQLHAWYINIIMQAYIIIDLAIAMANIILTYPETGLSAKTDKLQKLELSVQPLHCKVAIAIATKMKKKILLYLANHMHTCTATLAIASYSYTLNF